MATTNFYVAPYNLKIKRELNGQGFVPVVRKRKPRGRKRSVVWITEPICPGYVFFPTEPEPSTDGPHYWSNYLLGTTLRQAGSDVPVTLTSAELCALPQYLNEEELHRQDTDPSWRVPQFRVGQEVVFRMGALEGSHAKVTEVHKYTLLVTLLNSRLTVCAATMALKIV